MPLCNLANSYSSFKTHLRGHRSPLEALFDAPGTCRDCHSGSHNSLKRMKTGLGKFWLRHPDLADSRGATCSGKGGRGSVCLSHLLSLVSAPVLTLTVAFSSACFFSTIQERDSEKAHDVHSAGTTISPPLCLLLLSCPLQGVGDSGTSSPLRLPLQFSGFFLVLHAFSSF